jgi:hypothetical protein
VLISPTLSARLALRRSEAPAFANGKAGREGGCARCPAIESWACGQ